MQDLDVLDVEGFFLFCISLGVSKQGISSSVSFALTIVDSEVVARKLLDPADLFRAQAFCLYKSTEIVLVGEYKHLMRRPF